MKMNLNKCPGNRRDKPANALEICSHFYPATNCHHRDGGEAIPKVRTLSLLFPTCLGPYQI